MSRKRYFSKEWPLSTAVLHPLSMTCFSSIIITLTAIYFGDSLLNVIRYRYCTGESGANREGCTSPTHRHRSISTKMTARVCQTHSRWPWQSPWSLLATYFGGLLCNDVMKRPLGEGRERRRSAMDPSNDKWQCFRHGHYRLIFRERFEF